MVDFRVLFKTSFGATTPGGALNRNKNAEVKMSKKFLTSDPLGVILCGESIARTPEAWKRFFDPDSGKSVY